MRILILAHMPAKAYSGGRYHAWIMAEALAHMKNEVYIVCDNIPVFSKDFTGYPEHKNLHICLCKDFERFHVNKNFDFIYVIPSIGFDEALAQCALRISAKSKAKLALLNFETPNWFNLYSDDKRSKKEARKWEELCKYGCLVQSSAFISQKYAKLFYCKYPDNTYFDVWYPCINSRVADSIECEKENQIVIMLRLMDKHKGSNDLFSIVDEYLKGWKLVCIVGNGQIDEEYFVELETLSRKYGFTFEFRSALSDYEKFMEIKKAKILLFPSYFEGYGYPPVEAQYCNTTCIAYDLPVLKEVSGNGICYCKYGNPKDMRRVLEEAIQEGRNKQEIDLKNSIKKKAEFHQSAEALQNMLEKNMGRIQRNNRAYKQFWLHFLGRKIRNELEEKIFGVPAGIKKYVLQSGNGRKESWKQFKKAVKNRKLYVFGDGIGFYYFNKIYGKRYKVEAVLDNNRNLWEKPSNIDRLLLVLPPDEINLMGKKDCVVLITNLSHTDDIRTQLKKMHVKRVYSFIQLERGRLRVRMLYNMKHR